jgi:hypothetical protein
MERWPSATEISNSSTWNHAISPSPLILQPCTQFDHTGHIITRFTDTICVSRSCVRDQIVTSCFPTHFYSVHFHSKTLRMIVDAPWHVPNTVIRRDHQTPAVKEEIRRYSSQYNARLAHPSGLVVNLTKLPDNRRLRRHLPNDLPTRFLV